MLTELYSIGETSEINGISVKTLRFYDEIGLLKPRHTDPKTGYRYYTYDQFPYIDKIKRYKNMGVPLKELKTILEGGDLEALQAFLEKRKRELEEETRRLVQMKADVEWLSEYMEYSHKLDVVNGVFMRQLPEQHFVAVPVGGHDTVFEMDMELRRVVSAPPLCDVATLNPYGYILDFDALAENKMEASYVIVALSELPPFPSEYIFTAPAGNYVCCQTKLLSSNWSVSPLLDFCSVLQKPKLVLALEHLTSFYDYKGSTYDIQLLI